MRSNTHFLRREPFASGLMSLVVFLVVTPISHAQDGIAKHARGAQAEHELKVGSQVVLKASDTPLDNNGKPISIQDNLRTWIHKIDGEQLLLIVSDVMKMGWVRRDQVVPWDKAMDYFDGEIAKNPRNADAFWSRRPALV